MSLTRALRLNPILSIAVCLLMAFGLQPALAASTTGAPPEVPQIMPAGTQSVFSAPLIAAGAHIPHIVYANTEIDAFNKLTGKDAAIVMEFYPWSNDFDDSKCGHFDHIFAHDRNACGGNLPGAEIHSALMLTWEPNSIPTNYRSCGVFQNGSTNLDAIINGSCDAYIDNFATRLKNWAVKYNDTFMMRIMHEMNITNSPWWANDPGQPAKFVAAFRHIHDRFTAVGAVSPLVQFVWSPNYRSSPNVSWNAIPNYYPGDTYVDWIGLSGYNFYTSRANQPWMTFADIYDSTDPMLNNTSVLRYLMCNYAKPIVFAEFGSIDGPSGAQTKAAWIADAYAQMQKYPFVRAVTWFNDFAYNDPTNADMRITQGSWYDPNILHYPGRQAALSNWTQAYAQAIAGTSFTKTLPALGTITPQATYCGPIPPVAPSPQLAVSGNVLAKPGQSAQAIVTARDMMATPSLSVIGLPATYSYIFTSVGTASASAPFTTTSVLTIKLPVDASVGNIDFTVQGKVDATTFTASAKLFVRNTIYFNFAPIFRR